jgi:hypothetical protein
MERACDLAYMALLQHPYWCGFNKDAPGDASYNEAVAALREVLRVGGCNAIRAVEAHEALDALLAENQQLREEIRVREDSQIPVIPHGAQAKMDGLEAENQRLRDALRIATREWWSWMESARLGYDDEVPTQDDLDVFAEINALAAVRVEETPRYRCEDCAWTGSEPTEAEHPNNEFPIALLCPECAGAAVRVEER